jgi:hypothetical protein
MKRLLRQPELESEPLAYLAFASKTFTPEPGYVMDSGESRPLAQILEETLADERGYYAGQRMKKTSTRVPGNAWQVVVVEEHDRAWAQQPPEADEAGEHGIEAVVAVGRSEAAPPSSTSPGGLGSCPAGPPNSPAALMTRSRTG